ncbi:glycoside hydrolase family 43 protein [Deinococcus pimensis]|uniref:glycoside hydrolase family 43 protein n=1 Tax=Deinococcus pimensis TaxID=309888 RepID=UPI0009FE5AE7|nr:glycoside hydrolase family 43 protein [Deinococcus pimensis]
MTASTPVESALTVLSEAHVGNTTFSNPLDPRDFPDPFILNVDGTYYAYATNTPEQHLPLRRSRDLVTWEDLPDAMGPLPRWARAGLTWAPDVMAVPGGFVLYYTVRHRRSGQQVIGAAFSTSPEGPFVDASRAPLITQHDLGGAIDAHAFIDTDGQRYLYWKNDGNSRGLRTWLWVQKLSEDGLTLLGRPRKLIRNDRTWERHLIEAPFVVAREGRYHLFYSAAHYDDATYCVGHAVSHSPLGPFVKDARGPLLATHGHVAGPGGQGVITDACGATWMYYHAWTAGQAGYATGGARSLRIDPLHWVDGQPVIAPPALASQLAPATAPAWAAVVLAPEPELAELAVAVAD